MTTETVATGITGVSAVKNSICASLFVTVSTSTTIPAYGTKTLGTLPSSLKPNQPFYAAAIGRKDGSAFTVGIRVEYNGVLNVYNTSSSSVTLSAIEAMVTYLL